MKKEENNKQRKSIEKPLIKILIFALAAIGIIIIEYITRYYKEPDKITNVIIPLHTEASIGYYIAALLTTSAFLIYFNMLINDEYFKKNPSCKKVKLTKKETMLKIIILALLGIMSYETFIFLTAALVK